MTPEEREGLASFLEPELKPYKDVYERRTQLPADGLAADQVLAVMTEMSERERDRWESGFASGAVYHGGREHVELLDRVYALFSQTNPLHPDLWPSIGKFEAEVVAMTATMLHGGDAAPDACGTVTSGGTESILLAMKTYRDRARVERGVDAPEVVLPVTAHAAFDKASQYFGIRLVKVPVDESTMQADVGTVRDALSPRTVAVVGSAVQFPHGVADPIADMAAIAAEARVGFHTDACLGGFVLPWAERLGHPVSPWDFRVPGVTSISCDTHKFGYAAKGTSVLLWRDEDWRAHQYFTVADWPGGLYWSPTFAGSRPGGLIAEAWAALVTIGESGYLEATRAVLDAAGRIRRGIEGVDGLRVLGDPLWVIAFAADDDALSVYDVQDRMARRGWSLNGLQSPPAVHICVTVRHTAEGVAERFVDDLRACVAEAREEPGGSLMAPVYGLAGSVETHGAVHDILRTYADVLYRA